MAKDDFNGASRRSGADFKVDKGGRQIKTEEDLASVRIRADDGSMMTVRGGKVTGISIPKIKR